MSLPHKSVATIDNIEFINLTPLDINPLMSKCEIKVFYLGKNRNGSYIKKEVALNMAKTLRGAPIVGYYKELKEDFRDHGEKVTLDSDGIHFECLTKPYGFVSPDAQVWFKKFTEEDDFGNVVEREYLMTTGYLWTDQFPQVKKVFDQNGKPQSMELDNKTIDGHWASENNNGPEFFIINDAIISKLCILGDDIEPCFEGSSITAPQISNAFTKIDDNFNKTLFTMMKELEFALQGGKNTVDKKNMNISVDDTQFSEQNEDKNVENFVEENQKDMTETSDSSNFVDTEEKKKEEEEKEGQEEKEDKKFAEDKQTDGNAENRIENHPLEKKDIDGTIERQSEEGEPSQGEPSEGGPSAGYTKADFENLQNSYNDLQEKYNELVEFKNKVEDQQKDELIAKFFMLSDEDKKDIVENKRNYSLEQIEEKLAVICFRKKVSFDLDNTSKNQKQQTEETVVTFNMNDVNDSTPDWIKEVEEVQKKL